MSKGDEISGRLLDFTVRIIKLVNALPKTIVGNFNLNNFDSFVKKLKIINDWIPACQDVAETVFCHPEFISGSHNQLILLDAEIADPELDSGQGSA